jgi:hypothetical protein
MNPIIPNGGEVPSKALENGLDEHEIGMAKKAARAFAVSYLNEIFTTVNYLDKPVLEKLYVTRHYPYYLYVVIQQQVPRKIGKLMLFTEQKHNGDGLCEVVAMHHSSEEWDPKLAAKIKHLADEEIYWTWTDLDVTHLYKFAIAEGRRFAFDIYFKFALAPVKKLQRQRIHELMEFEGPKPTTINVPAHFFPQQPTLNPNNPNTHSNPIL